MPTLYKPTRFISRRGNNITVTLAPFQPHATSASVGQASGTSSQRGRSVPCQVPPVARILPLYASKTRSHGRSFAEGISFPLALHHERHEHVHAATGYDERQAAPRNCAADDPQSRAQHRDTSRLDNSSIMGGNECRCCQQALSYVVFAYM